MNDKEFFESIAKGISFTSRYKNNSDWIFTKQIDVFKTPNVKKEVIPYVLSGINDMIKEVSLDLKVIYIDATKQIQNAVNYASLNNERIDERVIESVYKENIKLTGKNSAIVIITDKLFVDKVTMDNRSWGYSDYSSGGIVLAFSGNRQNSLEFIKNLVKHETGHLLGYDQHHKNRFYDIPKIYEKFKGIECVMDWEASTSYLCDMCKDSIINHWKNIENKTGKKFLFKKF